MKKVYIGLDVHKENILIALAFADRSDPESYGKASSDLDGFLKILRRIQEKYDLRKEDVALCYEAGPTGFLLCRRLRDLGGPAGGRTYSQLPFSSRSLSTPVGQATPEAGKPLRISRFSHCNPTPHRTPAAPLVNSTHRHLPWLAPRACGRWMRTAGAVICRP